MAAELYSPSVPTLFEGIVLKKDAFTVERHFDFRLRLHFCFSDLSFQKVERQSRDFRIQVRFQISDLRKGEESKSGLRFQISDFRLAQGSEIEREVSISDFRLAQGREIVNVSFISISGFDCRVASEEN